MNHWWCVHMSDFFGYLWEVWCCRMVWAGLTKVCLDVWLNSGYLNKTVHDSASSGNHQLFAGIGVFIEMRFWCVFLSERENIKRPVGILKERNGAGCWLEADSSCLSCLITASESFNQLPNQGWLSCQDRTFFKAAFSLGVEWWWYTLKLSRLMKQCTWMSPCSRQWDLSFGQKVGPNNTVWAQPNQTVFFSIFPKINQAAL